MKKAKAKTPKEQPWTGEIPTPERLRKAGDAISHHKTDEGRTAFRFTDGDILEHMQARSMIDGDQYGAGKQFYSDWYNSGLAASGVVDPGRVIVDGGNPEPGVIRRMEFAQRWTIACRAIGAVHLHPLTDMVLLDTPATTYAMRHMGMKDPKDCRLGAYILLKAALDALVLHYYGQRRMRASYHRGERFEVNPSVRETA